MADADSSACPVCGQGIQHNGGQRRTYCSSKCRKVAEGRRWRAKGGARMAPRGPFSCQGRGKEYFTTRHKGEGETYCSRRCAFTHIREWHGNTLRFSRLPEYSQVKPCEACGKLHGNMRAQYCSESCRPSAQVAAKPEYVCAGCGAMYEHPKGMGRPSKYCGNKCRKDAARKERKRYGGTKHRNRAKRYGVPYEPVNIMRVFMRDGWRCQICGKATPTERRGTRYSNAPELDHRIPLSRGGPHSYDNVQCACRACNSAKSNKSEAGQLPLLVA